MGIFFGNKNKNKNKDTKEARQRGKELLEYMRTHGNTKQPLGQTGSELFTGFSKKELGILEECTLEELMKEAKISKKELIDRHDFAKYFGDKMETYLAHSRNMKELQVTVNIGDEKHMILFTPNQTKDDGVHHNIAVIDNKGNEFRIIYEENGQTKQPQWDKLNELFEKVRDEMLALKHSRIDRDLPRISTDYMEKGLSKNELDIRKQKAMSEIDRYWWNYEEDKVDFLKTMIEYEKNIDICSHRLWTRQQMSHMLGIINEAKYPEAKDDREIIQRKKLLEKMFEKINFELMPQLKYPLSEAEWMYLNNTAYHASAIQMDGEYIKNIEDVEIAADAFMNHFVTSPYGKSLMKLYYIAEKAEGSTNREVEIAVAGRNYKIRKEDGDFNAVSIWEKQNGEYKPIFYNGIQGTRGNIDEFISVYQTKFERKTIGAYVKELIEGVRKAESSRLSNADETTIMLKNGGRIIIFKPEAELKDNSDMFNPDKIDEIEQIDEIKILYIDPKGNQRLLMEKENDNEQRIEEIVNEIERIGINFDGKAQEAIGDFTDDPTKYIESEVCDKQNVFEERA